MPKRLNADDLDDSRSTDPRWTESKLVAAGYTFHGDGKCRGCGDPVSFYKKEHRDATKPVWWMIVDEGALSRHVCQGR